MSDSLVVRSRRLAPFLLEWLLIAVLACAYAGTALLDFDAGALQQSGEHNESATPLLLIESARSRGELPLWNPFMITGFPLSGDLMSHLWHPVATLPALTFGAINGMKVSAFAAFLIAGLGQWLFGYSLGLGRTLRLWSAAIFMLSGGLAMLWRAGWYALLLGAVWFPWCFALYWRALDRRALGATGLASLAIFMVLSAGGGYHPLYLLICLPTLTLVYAATTPGSWAAVAKTAAGVVALATVFSAVILFPYADAFRYAERTVPPDVLQPGAQSIVYGLMNYVIHTPEWLDETVLGTSGGWTWFYIGWLPVTALAFVPLAFSRRGPARRTLAAAGALWLALMVWFANRDLPVRWIYDAFPALYALRFPNRLLVIAASPLLVLGGIALQDTWRATQAAVADRGLRLSPRRVVSGPAVVTGIWLVLLTVTVAQVYTVNKKFAFVNGRLHAPAERTLHWLREHDPSLYYVDLNGTAILWDWLPAAHALEMPAVNFVYSRRLRSQARESGDERWSAHAKYLVYRPEHEPPNVASLQKLRSFDDVVVWYAPEALPYAFTAPESALGRAGGPRRDEVAEVPVRLDGPNRIVVDGAATGGDGWLVVLASDYPGWEVAVDGKPALLEPVNGYLATRLRAGAHRYVFRFRPPLQRAGLVVSILGMASVGLVASLSSVRRIVVRRRWLVACLAGSAVLIAGFLAWTGGERPAARRAPREAPASPRAQLFEELQPVALANCDLQRFGEAHDGGYLLCANLLDGVGAGYSYGIGGYDGWGCDVSRQLGIVVHQYDCFDLTRPACPSGRTVFHAECVASASRVEDGRIFGTLAEQVEANGDAGRSLVLKMDVEGAEWDSWLSAPDALLAQIDQIAVEFHQVDDPRFVATVRRLKQQFHVAHLHFNNFSCDPALAPFPAWAYEVLFVNKKIGRVDPGGTVRRLHPLDAPNNPRVPDCQPDDGG